MQIENRLGAVEETGSLKRRGHESGAPNATAPGRFVIVVQQHDEAGQVVIRGPQPIVDPRTEAGSPCEHASRVHHAHAADMIDPVAGAGANLANVVDTLANVR